MNKEYFKMADDDLGQDLDADVEGEDGENPEGEGSGGGFGAKKIILFVLVPLFLIGAVGGGLYFTGIIGGGDASQESAETKGGGDEKSKKKDDSHGESVSYKDAYFLEIPNMIVNLSSEDGSTRYLRLSVQLELKTEEDKAIVAAVLPRVVDQFQTYLRELRVRDLRGSQGIYRLQMELLARVNAAAYPIEVQDVLFQEILIQ